MTDDRKYSGLRSIVMQHLTQHEILPVVFEGENLTVAQALNIDSAFYSQILPFPQKVMLHKYIEKLFAESPTKTINGAFNDNIPIICWIVANGIVDSEGNLFFSEDDIVVFSSKYIGLVYALAWAVVKTNDVLSEDKQNTVGNSDGTEQPSISSEQLAN